MSLWTHTAAHAKVNLALVVGPTRGDGKHEVMTVLQRIGLADTIAVRPASEIEVDGFPADTVVRAALRALDALTGVRFSARIDKRIPVASGLGGGSSDAAAALRLANGLLPEPLPFDELHGIAAGLGSDVPFFLRDGPCVGRGNGTELEPLALPVDYFVLLAVPHAARKMSTADVYARFDERGGAVGFDERRSRLESIVRGLSRPDDLAALPPNDLVSSPLTDELHSLGAFRADASGAGPTVYGLFRDEEAVGRASAALVGIAETWATRPVGGS